MSDTYTNRHLEMQTVKRIDGGAITGSSGLTASAPAHVTTHLAVGDEYGIETLGSTGWGATICGFMKDGVWLHRKSDQQIEQERQDWIADNERRKDEQLARNRRDWANRDEALPGWLHDRIAVFHRKGGEAFRRDGWGYELVVCELAAMYADNGCTDDAAIDAYAEQHGTSGNQHGCAKSLARAHLAGHSLEGTVAALSPITGDAFYEQAATK